MTYCTHHLGGAFECRSGACYDQHSVHSSAQVLRLLQAQRPPQQPTSWHESILFGV